MQNKSMTGRAPELNTHAASDKEILDRYFDRSEAAIRMTEEKYGAYCRSIAGNLLRDKRDAEECVSDTWFKAWNSIPPARPLNFKAYLGRIARNGAINLIRRDGAEKRAGDKFAVALDELGECIAEEDNPVDRAAENSAISDCVNGYLKTQPTEKRQMFVMRYFYLDSIADIAADLGMRESRVKTTLFRMRAELKGKMLEQGLG